MRTSMGQLFARFWNDDTGAVLTTEYLSLGTIVVLGGASGLVALRDAEVDEMKEFGKSVHTLHQSYREAAQQSAFGSRGGANVTNTPRGQNAGSPSQYNFAPPSETNLPSP